MRQPSSLQPLHACRAVPALQARPAHRRCHLLLRLLISATRRISEVEELRFSSCGQVEDVNTRFLCAELRAIGWRVCKASHGGARQAGAASCLQAGRRMLGTAPGPIARWLAALACTYTYSHVLCLACTATAGGGFCLFPLAHVSHQSFSTHRCMWWCFPPWPMSQTLHNVSRQALSTHRCRWWWWVMTWRPSVARCAPCPLGTTSSSQRAAWVSAGTAGRRASQQQACSARTPPPPRTPLNQQCPHQCDV